MRAQIANTESQPIDTVNAGDDIDIASFAIESVGACHESRIEHLGTALTDTVRFSDGSVYDRRLYIPYGQRYDRVVSLTTPWFTGIDSESNDLATPLLSLGMPVMVESAPSHSWRDIPRLHRIVRLERDAKAHHQMLDDLEQSGIQATDEIINYGFSKGAIDGFGIQSLAAEHNRKVAYFEYVDPVVEHPLSSDELQPIELAAYLGKELVAAATSLAESGGLKRFKHAVADSRNFFQHAAAAFSIFSGDAGLWAHTTPKDAVGNITFLKSSRFNQATAYRQNLADHPYIHFAEADGYHASGNNRRMQQASISRILLAQNLLADGQPLENVIWSQVESVKSAKLIA